MNDELMTMIIAIIMINIIYVEPGNLCIRLYLEWIKWKSTIIFNSLPCAHVNGLLIDSKPKPNCLCVLLMLERRWKLGTGEAYFHPLGQHKIRHNVHSVACGICLDVTHTQRRY